MSRPGAPFDALTALLVALAALVLAACSGTTSDDVAGDVEGNAAAATTDGGDAATSGGGSAQDGGSGQDGEPGASTTTEPRGELGSGETVTLAFGGDASFEGLESSLESDPDGLLDAIEPTLAGADVAMVNLEAALTTGGTPAPKTYNFRVPPASVDALGAAGVDVVTMANNHGLDYGEEGLAESLSIRDSSRTDQGVAIIGIGTDADDAYSPEVVEAKGQRIGVIAATDVLDSSLQAAWTAGPDSSGLASAKEGEPQDRLLAAVEGLRDEVDTLVVYLHMGVEKDICPTERQEALTDALHDAGADVVIGSHAHRLQGAGFRNGEFVAYGLGNYIFRGPSAESRMTATLLVDVTGRQVEGYRWEPAVIDGNVPVPLSEEAGAATLDALEERRECAGLAAAP